MAHYTSRRMHYNAPAAEFKAAYRPISDVFHSEVGTLDYWLTERYCLYAADGKGKLYRGEILHAPWSLQRAEATINLNTMAKASGIPLLDESPLLHYAHSIDVLAWALERIEP